MMRKQFTSAFKAKVVQELLKEEKTLAQISSEYEVHPTQLKNWRARALQGLPSLFEKQESAAALKAAYEQQIGELYAEIGKLTTQLNWLKKSIPVEARRASGASGAGGKRIPALGAGRPALDYRSSLYYQPREPWAEEIALKHRIDEISTRSPFDGSRKITEQLRREGVVIARKTVQRHLREMGMVAIYPGPNLSRRQHKEHVSPYLLRGLVINSPNQVWGIDLTSIRMQRGWMYLVAVLDCYSRDVVSWELDHTMELPFVLSAVRQALTVAVPEIWKSDQGSHFTSQPYQQLLHEAQVKISMDGVGRAIENIFTERLWRTIKSEEVYLHDYASPREARHQLAQYFEFYNHRRLHQAWQYRTPAEVYGSVWAKGGEHHAFTSYVT